MCKIIITYYSIVLEAEINTIGQEKKNERCQMEIEVKTITIKIITYLKNSKNNFSYITINHIKDKRLHLHWQDKRIKA